MIGQTSSVYVCNLPPGTNEALLSEHFGQIGIVKKDRRTGRPKIWIYYDKSTNEPKGDATVTYEDPHAASAAVEWFDNKDFRGNLIRVSIAESRFKDTSGITEQASVYSDQAPASLDPLNASEYPQEAEYGGADGMSGDPTDTSGAGRGRGRGDVKWQQEGDWPCPNPSCNNINFSFRGVCNRCNAARPAGGAGSGGPGGGRGRGRGAEGRGGRGASAGLFGPNDWSCPMCANVNWAKRTKCNICNTTKPGHNEGGVREGRAGGYKELDEAELEATKRRRREIEDDDGEMYDEFGNLKKKFRLRAKHGEPAGAGLGGWDKEELGVVEKDGKRGSGSSGSHRGEERSNGYEPRESDDRRRDYDRRRDRERDRDRERARSKERDQERDRDGRDRRRP